MLFIDSNVLLIIADLNVFFDFLLLQGGWTLLLLCHQLLHQNVVLSSALPLPALPRPGVAQLLVEAERVFTSQLHYAFHRRFPPLHEKLFSSRPCVVATTSAPASPNRGLGLEHWHLAEFIRGRRLNRGRSLSRMRALLLHRCNLCELALQVWGHLYLKLLLQVVEVKTAELAF